MSVAMKFSGRVWAYHSARPELSYGACKGRVIDQDQAEALETHAWKLKHEHVAAGGILPD